MGSKGHGGGLSADCATGDVDRSVGAEVFTQNELRTRLKRECLNHTISDASFPTYYLQLYIKLHIV